MRVVMPLDRERIKYLIDDLKTRPERVRILQRVGMALAVVLALGVTLLLARGGPDPKAKTKVVIAPPVDPMTQGVRDAFDYAKAALPILNKDSRFARVYFVPSAATPTQKVGKVVIMGEMASEADIQALKMELAKIGVSVPIEWQVSVQPSAEPSTGR